MPKSDCVEEDIQSIIVSIMSGTVNNFSIPFICDICQLSSGLSSADRRSIIVLVVLTAIALVACYIGVLCYAIRTRYLPEEKLAIIPDIVFTNGAFNGNGEQGDNDDDTKANILTTVIPDVAQPVVIEMEEREERF